MFGFRLASHSEGFHDDLRKGSELTQEEAQLLEKNLKNRPNDVSSRTQLLGFYMHLHPLHDPSGLEAKHKHILWFVQNSPEADVLGTPEGMILGFFDPIGYSTVKEAWMTQLERNPKNVTMLGNAANFLSVTEYESAIKLLQRAQSLEPSNPKWARELGQKYVHKGLFETKLGSPEGVKQAAGKAFAQFEKAYVLEDERGKGALLADLAKTALAADQLTNARKYAEIALQIASSGADYGNLIHHGNVVLGRIALREDNLNEARNRLISAGKTPGSPNLDSFGPSMALAKELLEKGERAIVLEYFRLCSKFWATEQAKDQLDKWTVLVNGGRIPEFGANLEY